MLQINFVLVNTGWEGMRSRFLLTLEIKFWENFTKMNLYKQHNSRQSGAIYL